MPCFLAGPDGQRDTDVFVVVFSVSAQASVRVSVASVGVLALAGIRPAGARKPQGGRTLSTPLPLGYVPEHDSGLTLG